MTFSASDPTGGAGLQADLLAVSALGGHALTVVTGLTAQNTQGVLRFEPTTADWVAAQLDALLTDSLQPCAFKAGVLGSQHAVDALLGVKARWPGVPLVVDPVRASGRGDGFGAEALFEYLKTALFPVVDVLTPNWPEAQAFTGQSQPEAAAQALLGMGCKAVLLKGEHLPGGQVVNSLYTINAAPVVWPCERLPGQYHGSGCTLASALATLLALGQPLEHATGLALDYTWHTLAHGFDVGEGQAIPDRLWRAKP
ncbi:hydroxymethylpyrimidine/phosphomethylpyrimidine kinase [Limnobacter sp.]|uniref:bifunctional hydroxymethylpyrimidine kinase/phosphomethylpyrimidine kinase n=1 Tax=Limnobacter sp. TaxID=2003368 RepID=UPI003516C1C8